MAEKDKEPEIKVITDDDDKFKIAGELLSTQKSIDLMKFLMSKSTYKQKISDETEIPYSLVEYHLKKLEQLGLVKIKKKKLIKGGVYHNIYSIRADGLLLLFNTEKEVEEKGILKKIIKEGVKFASIGIVSFFIWFYKMNDPSVEYSRETTLEDPLTIPLIIIIIGLIILLIKKRKKE